MSGPVGKTSLTQWQLIAKRFARHKLAVVAIGVLAVFYTVAIFAEFFAPYSESWRDVPHAYSPAQPPRFSFSEGFHTYDVQQVVDPVTFDRNYRERPDVVVPLGFFVRGEKWHVLGLFETERHFFGVDEAAFRARYPGEDVVPTFYLLGADMFGRDVFSRIVHGARISLTIGLVAIVVLFVLGVTIGGISGYVGGKTDTLIQRFMEILNSIPQLPLWVALAVALPEDLSQEARFFGITILLALKNWTGLARVVRGKILSLREEDYATAARLLGASHGRVLFVHLVPGFTSHILVSLTLAIPGMILAETSLSFLGLGLQPPAVSWGVMLQDCLNLQVLGEYPWLLLPAFFIIITVLSFNFLGDGLRDAADPYAGK